MTTKHIDGARTKMLKADQSDTLYVLDKNASITLDGDFGVGIFGFSDAVVSNRDFRILGDINVKNGFGVAVGSNDGSGAGELFIGSASEITVSTGTAVMTSADGEHIDNHGTLKGTMGIEAKGEDVVIENAGSVIGSTTGIDMGFHSGRLVNTGTIIGGDDAVTALMLSGESLSIVNHGSISANDDAIVLSNLAGARTVVRNSGEIIGGDYAIIGNFAVATEIVRNSGTITGRVWLGDGNDVYDGRGGTASEVSGGGNDDLYIIGDLATKVWEMANNGTDTVKAKVTWTLADNFENLTLIGSAGLTGKGNDAANTIRGNAGSNMLWGYDGVDVIDGGKGDDTMNGGIKSDYFVFSTGSGHDTIADFFNGIDTIDLRGVDGLDAYSDIQAAAQNVGSDLVLTFEGGDTLTVTGFSLAGMTQDDFMF